MKTRELHLVDVENLLAGPFFLAAEVARLRPLYGRVSQMTASAHVVIGCSADESMLESGLGWCGARQVWIRGTDGADRALLDVAFNENVAGRFARVVIGSGDGIFANLAANLQALGCHVTVVSRADALSARLRFAVADIRILPPKTMAGAFALQGAA